MTELKTRKYADRDIPEMCQLINEIIEIGGTTAHEELFDEERFAEHFLSERKLISCIVAVDQNDTIAGFQAAEMHPGLPEDWADIATFARVSPKTPGVGTALFAATRKAVEAGGFVAINATIRADNESGLSFYKKMGFETYGVRKNVPLSDGTEVDRINKRFILI